MDVVFDVTGHRLIERTTLFLSDQGEADFDADHREFYYPERRALLRLAVDSGPYGATWTARHQAGMENVDAGIDDWDEAITGGSDTCYGPPNDLLCRDVGFTDNYWVHTFSMRYRGDTWRVSAGARNVFDTPPPVVDGTEIYSVNNTPLGAGYDVNGRVFFLQAVVELGGGY